MKNDEDLDLDGFFDIDMDDIPTAPPKAVVQQSKPNHEDLFDLFDESTSFTPHYNEFLPQLKKIPIRFIERYLREKKLENLNNKDIT